MKKRITLAEKILGLRVFRDENDKMNLSLSDVGGEVLVVSQFTLYGDVSPVSYTHLRSGYNGPDSKSGVPATVPWVRLPPPPPKRRDTQSRVSFLFGGVQSATQTGSPAGGN